MRAGFCDAACLLILVHFSQGFSVCLSVPFSLSPSSLSPFSFCFRTAFSLFSHPLPFFPFLYPFVLSHPICSLRIICSLLPRSTHTVSFSLLIPSPSLLSPSIRHFLLRHFLIHHVLFSIPSFIVSSFLLPHSSLPFHCCLVLSPIFAPSLQQLRSFFFI